MGFPLLSLEPMLVKDALEHTSVFDILNTALASPDTRRLISKYARIKLREIQVTVSRRCSIAVIGWNGRTDRFQWEIRSEMEQNQWNYGGQEAWRETVYLGGGKWDMLIAKEYPSFSSIDHSFVTISSDVVSTMETILKLLQTIFRQPVTSILSVNTDLFTDFERMKTWNLHCGIFKFRFNANNNRVPGHFLKSVLDNFKLDDVRCVQRRVKPGFRFEKPLVIRHIRLIAGWIKMRHLLEMQAENVYIRAPKLSQQDINLFIKKWIAGETGQKLKTISLNRLRFKVDANETFTGITKYPKTIIRYREGDLDSEVYWRLEEGFDIRRDTDGTVATVVWDDFRKNHIVIVVKPQRRTFRLT